PMPSVTNEPIVTSPETGQGQKLTEGIKFTLKDITFENLTAFSKEQLRPEYGQYLGKKITLATLNEIASNITVRYRNAGYILSRAVVPPQRINGGAIKIRIVEGYVDRVTFEGDPITGGLLKAYADKIRNAKPLDSATLERYLLLMNDLPG